TPVDLVDRYDVFFSSLVLLSPLVLAAGFTWEGANAQRLRIALWVTAVAWLLIAVVPWPSKIDFGEGHSRLLLLFALSASVSGQLVHSRPLPTWLSAPSE